MDSGGSTKKETTLLRYSWGTGKRMIAKLTARLVKPGKIKQAVT